ncbi:MAG: AroM family protein [Armatimonadota bacterium]|nr:AroM family protein [Armatimonadota bacterium]MDR5702058.1 AroM family protein [Armatimonadota bacterium]
MTLGVLTIGQSPRDDVLPTLREVLGDVPIVEGGALDGCMEDEIVSLAPHPGESILVTRLRDGRAVTLARDRVLPYVQRALEHLENSADLILFLCTGELPSLCCSRFLIEPARLLHQVVCGVAAGRTLGVLVPLPEQVREAEERWKRASSHVIVKAVTPYGGGDFSSVGRELKAAGAEIVVMDCMGYRVEQKRLVIAASGLPTILAGTAVARVVRELISS